MNPRKYLLLLASFLFAMPVFAQDKSLKASDDPKPAASAPAPAEVTLSPAAAQALDYKVLAARLAESEVNNFILRVQQAEALLKTARADLQNLQATAKAATDAAQATFIELAVKAGIPKDQLDKYEQDGPPRPDGSIVMKRKKQ